MSHGSSRALVVVFHDATYPQACPDDILYALLQDHFEVQFVGATELADRLAQSCDLLLSFHGQYFPRDAWPALLRYLEAGGNLAVFGGMPFTRPVHLDGTVEPAQQAYSDLLYLGPFYQLEPPATDLHLVASHNAEFLDQATLPVLPAEQQGTFWSFYPRLTQVLDHPEQLGSAGPLDTILLPLIFANSTTSVGEQHIATPLQLLEQQHGRFKGGRWLLSPWLPSSQADWLRYATILQQALQLATENCVRLVVRPLLASYQPGEAASLLISVRTLQALSLSVTVSTPQQTILTSFVLDIPAAPVLQETQRLLPAQTEPGLYKIEVHYQHGVALRQETGFWIWDETLVAATANKHLTGKREHFYQDGQPFLVFGTTYMDSRVQRKFLLLPNPARWDADFAEMQRSGINTIRTGIWTAWHDLMPDAGITNEAYLRALDAFVMTACKYNMQVIFTFFSFFPPLFAGENPWLDPRSLEGQQDFVATIARRYAAVGLVAWDLINEPSFGDPDAIFSQRPLPNYDRFELVAFQNWLAARYTIAELQLRWRQTSVDFTRWEQITLPVAEDYNADVRNSGHRHMLKVMDYTYFSQEMFRNWATLMRKTIRATGSTTLVGVGQDEAGARLSPQFYAPAVDYTTTHPWWNNDDLLCDMLLDKTLDTPNLIQEIGVMLVRNFDMRSARGEQACANLLERKLITGIIARGAGLIQWLWHTNAYMTSENENSIGLVRADGSVKPELMAMQEVGQLVQALAGQILEPTTPPDTWVIIPYSQWFARPDLAIEGVRQAIRVLGYELGIVPQMIGEHQLAEFVQRAHEYCPRTIILPSVQTFARPAWDALLTYVERGATLLVSGVPARDQHNLAANSDLVENDGSTGEGEATLVSRYERLEYASGQSSQLLFHRDKTGYVFKAHNRLKTYARGSGTIIWSGLPLELSSNANVVRAVYQQALSIARPGRQDENPVLVIKRPLKEGQLILLVSESSATHRVPIADDLTVQIAPERAGAVMLMNDGQLRCFGGVTVDVNFLQK